MTVAVLLSAGIGDGRAQSLDRAAEAEARGELRAAQIELRNAVRANPGSPVARARLGAVSLELGDYDVAEREVRAAMERGYNPVDGTRLLLRILLQQRKADEILRDFPLREQGTPAALAAQVAAARAAAFIMTDRLDDAAQSVADARRLGPDAVEPLIAAADLALARRDIDGAESATLRALTIDPESRDALRRRASIQIQRQDPRAALQTYGILLARHPADLQARLARAEIYVRLGEARSAQEDIDAALRTSPNSVGAIFLRALLQVNAADWQRADESLQRISPMLGNLPDGFLLLATTKRGLGQTAQAVDAAQRHVARHPEDPRGARLLATMELEAGHADDAILILNRLVERGGADSGSFELLSNAYAANRRPADAARALQRAVELAPENAQLQLRLSILRLREGNANASAEAARTALRLAPDRPEAREVLAAALLAVGRVDEAEAQAQRFAPGWQTREFAASVNGSLRLMRYDLDGAKTIFTNLLHTQPASSGARLGLAQIAAFEGNARDMLDQLGQTLQHDPNQPEALRRLALLALTPGEIGASALRLLEAAQAAAPADENLALILARVFMRRNEPARAVTLLDTEPLRARGRGVTLPMMRAEAHMAAGQWPEAEAASRAALAEDPDSRQARRQLALLLLRSGDARGAEALVQDGLRRTPDDALLQQTLVGIVNQSRGADAALALADATARDPASGPAGRMLRGEMLLGLGRNEEAGRFFTETFQQAPSRDLASRASVAWMRAGRADEASAVLDSWLAREPNDAAVQAARAQIDLTGGRRDQAIERLSRVIDLQPSDAVSLNNLAWALSERGAGDDMARARALAERAYATRPSPESADTLGWILARAGEVQRALPLLRSAASIPTQPPVAAGIAYRLAFVLNAVGERQQAQQILGRVLQSPIVFPERADAERLQAQLGG